MPRPSDVKAFVVFCGTELECQCSNVCLLVLLQLCKALHHTTPTTFDHFQLITNTPSILKTVSSSPTMHEPPEPAHLPPPQYQLENQTTNMPPPPISDSRPSMSADTLNTRPPRNSIQIQEPRSRSRSRSRRRSSRFTRHHHHPSISIDQTSSTNGNHLLPTLSNEALLSAGPPSLDYTLSTRRRAILFFWALILIDCIGVPIALYFGLWYGTSLSPNAVFSISTACLGGASIGEYVLRFWRLWKKGSTCRVLGARRAYLDWFHWNFSIGWFFVMCELIIGTAFTNPPIRLLAMPVATMLWWFAIQTILEDILRLLGTPSPVRISSMPKGARFRPGIYSIIEDVVAVDGSGGTRFRKRLNDRYEASHYFRQMLHRLTLFWSAGAAGAATLTTILVFTLERDAAYVVGWTLPFIWAGIWAPCTIWYVKRELRHEGEAWREVVRTEGIKGLAQWQTLEPRVRIEHWEPVAGESAESRDARISVDLMRRNEDVLRGVGDDNVDVGRLRREEEGRVSMAVG